MALVRYHPYIALLNIVLFSFLQFLPSGMAFFLGSMSIRVVEAVGDACFVTASFVISVKCFPRHISTVIVSVELETNVLFA